MRPDLVGYLWECLDEDEQRRVAEQLESDPKLRDDLATLRERLLPLEWDRDPEPAPAGLTVDTLARVAEHACRDRHLPKAPPVTRSAGSAQPWRRRIDIAVAASVALTALAILLPTLLIWRDRSFRIECQDNLRSMWTGLKEFQTVRQKLPDPGSVQRPVAGLVAPLLRDAGFLPRNAHLVCPATKATDSVGLTVDEIENLPPEQFAEVAPRLLPSYAYSLGYRDADGNLHPVDDMLRELKADKLPIIADAPAAAPALGNSPNHAGHGQNLLFMDGHASFQTTRTIGDDDIYLSRRNLPEAGADASDVVLLSSGTRP
jgi:hypothetical protein